MNPRLLLALALLTVPAAAAPPALIPHQGRITVDGVNYDGAGFFKFVLAPGFSNHVSWSNDGTRLGGVGDDEPDTHVQLDVQDGHYSFTIGSTFPLDPDVFRQRNNLGLRIWFASDPAGPFQQLPDLPLHSSPYALHANTAEKLSANGAANQNIDDTGSLRIGSAGDGTSRLATLELDGSVGNLALGDLGVFADNEDGLDHLANAADVAVSGDIAYVVSPTDHSLSILDITDSHRAVTPTVLAVVTDGLGGFTRLAGANRVIVVGTTAYVTARDDHALTLIDVTKPDEPKLIAEIVDNQNGFNHLAEPSDVFVDGTTAFVTSFLEDAMTIIDLETPENPALLAEVINGQGYALDGASSVFVSGKIAYVTATLSNSLSLINIANPVAPALDSELLEGQAGFTELDEANSVFVTGNHAYVVANESFSMSIVDISNSQSPLLVRTVRTSSSRSGDSTASLVVEDDIAYVSSSSRITLVDVSIPADPVVLLESDRRYWGLPTDLAVTSLAVRDRKLLVTSNSTEHSLLVARFARSTRQLVTGGGSVGIGTFAPRASLHVQGTAFFAGRLFDENFSPGTNGQVLTSTGDGIDWATPPPPLWAPGPSGSIYRAVGNVGIGTNSPHRDLHIRDKSLGIEANELSSNLNLLIESADAQLLLASDNGGSTGSAISFQEWSGGTAVNTWSIQRKTTSSGAALRFNFTDKPDLAVLQTDGDLVIQGALNAGSGGNIARTYNYFSNAAPNPSSGDMTGRGDLFVSDDLEVNNTIYADGGIDNSCDRNRKENIVVVDPAECLEKLMDVPIYRWNYIDDGDKQPHLGPMAQDFHAQFPFNNDDRYISSIDLDGVALASIQALKAENDALKSRLAKLEALVGELAAQKRTR